MDRNSLESELRLQDFRVLESRSLLNKQRSLIAELEEIGRDTRAAKEVLSKLLDLHRLREANLDRTRTELERLE